MISGRMTHANAFLLRDCVVIAALTIIAVIVAVTKTI